MPVFFFTKVPAMIRPQDDDSVFCIITLIESFKQLANPGIGIGNTGQIMSDGRFPFFCSSHFFQILILTQGHLLTRLGNIIEIFTKNFRQLDLIHRIEIEIFPRHVPGKVRMKNTTGQKERLGVFPSHKVGTEFYGLEIIHFTLLFWQHSPVYFRRIKCDATVGKLLWNRLRFGVGI